LTQPLPLIGDFDMEDLEAGYQIHDITPSLKFVCVGLEV